jgi:hypothetical protein
MGSFLSFCLLLIMDSRSMPVGDDLPLEYRT